MAMHRFRVGAIVYLQAGDGVVVSGAHRYLIEAHLPPLGTTLQYRVKSESEAFRRIVPEYLVSATDDRARTMPAAVSRSGEED